MAPRECCILSEWVAWVPIWAFHSVLHRKGPRSSLSRLKLRWRSKMISGWSIRMIEEKPRMLQTARTTNWEGGQQESANGIGSLWGPLQGKRLASSMVLVFILNSGINVNYEWWSHVSWCCFLCSKPLPVVDRSVLDTILDPDEYFAMEAQLDSNPCHFHWYFWLSALRYELITVSQCRSWRRDKTAKWCGSD